jgi:hypothetical protein
MIGQEVSLFKIVDSLGVAGTGEVCLARGDKTRAFECLEKAYSERDWALTIIKVDPDFDPVRSDPRFSDILKRMNLQ